MGGLSSLKFLPNNIVLQKKLSNEKEKVIKKAINNMFLVPSYMNRSADSVLKKFENNKNIQENIKHIRQIAESFISSTEKRDHILWNKFHNSVRESWEIKRSLSNVMNIKLNEKYEYLKKNIPNNWIRLIGAGSGGYFLVSIKDDIKNPLDYFGSIGFKDTIKANISEAGVSVSEF